MRTLILVEIPNIMFAAVPFILRIPGERFRLLGASSYLLITCPSHRRCGYYFDL